MSQNRKGAPLPRRTLLRGAAIMGAVVGGTLIPSRIALARPQDGKRRSGQCRVLFDEWHRARLEDRRAGNVYGDAEVKHGVRSPEALKAEDAYDASCKRYEAAMMRLMQAPAASYEDVALKALAIAIDDNGKTGVDGVWSCMAGIVIGPGLVAIRTDMARLAKGGAS